MIGASTPVGHDRTNVYMIVSLISGTLSTLTSSGYIIFVEDATWRVLRTDHWTYERLFLRFPRSFAPFPLCEGFSATSRVGTRVISRISFCMRQQICRLKAQVFIALCLAVMPIRPRGPLPYRIKFVLSPDIMSVQSSTNIASHMFSLNKILTYFVWQWFG